MDMKAYNPLSGKLEDITEEEVEVMEALKKQFQEDADLLLAETEIVKAILHQHLSETDDDERESTD
jgi:hypothetical protein